jgi:sec-independent protein translocase protein TatA
MGTFSWMHWVLVIGVFLLLFGGRGKISELMGDFAQGIKSFKKGMADEPEVKAEARTEPVKSLDHVGSTAHASGLANRAETEKRVEGSTL